MAVPNYSQRAESHNTIGVTWSIGLSKAVQTRSPESFQKFGSVTTIYS